ncbi:MAG: OmpA/MotB family protein [Desulfovibrionaceae bacterium]
MINNDKEEEESPPEWIGTFADLSLLLLVFFILLYSMSTIQVEKYSETFSSIRTSFGGKESVQGQISAMNTQTTSVLDSIRLRQQIIKSQERTFNQMQTYLTKNGTEGVVGAVFDEGVITLRLASEVLFGLGETSLSKEGEKALAPLLDIFIKNKNQSINIKGFTDNVAPNTGARYKDNWELSSLRSVSVLRYFIEHGIPAHRLTATGLGETDSLYPNTTKENKAKNRRIEFVLERRVVK